LGPAYWEAFENRLDGGVRPIDRPVLVRHPEPLDDIAADDVPLDDLLHVIGSADPVSDSLGIDDHARPELAGVQAAGPVGPHHAAQALTLDLGLEELPQVPGAAVHSTAS
jgi:hypothetical protein